MFEIPVTLTTKRLRNARKLRYQYVNNLSAKFNRLEGLSSNGLPTPENSAAESSENEGAIQRKRKRIRRKWKSVAGECLSDSEDDDESIGGETVEDDEDEDQERKFTAKYETPQESFEKWQNDSNKRMPISRSKISFTKYQKLQRHARRKMNASMDLASKGIRTYIDTISEGYEMVSPLEANPETFQMKHITIITTLLHLSISRRNWDAAYSCFTLLIRIPGVDIRNVWGVGDLILRERQPIKSLEFLEWLSSVYSSRSAYSEEVNHRTAPVFTIGSRTHVPKFAMTWMWESLIRCTKDSSETNEPDFDSNHDKLQDLIDKISEVVLAPPYMDASEVWFIYGMCHLVKADILSNQFDGRLAGSARDIASNQVIQHIQSTKSCLQTCLAKSDFHYPKRYVERQLELFEKRLNRQDEVSDGPYDDPGSPQDRLDTQSIESSDAYQYSISDANDSN